jgi:hypothetical protein
VRYRPSRVSLERIVSAGIHPPTMIDVQSSGSAVIYYGEQPMTEFRTLDAALRYHRLTADDLESVD